MTNFNQIRIRSTDTLQILNNFEQIYARLCHDHIATIHDHLCRYRPFTPNVAN